MRWLTLLLAPLTLALAGPADDALQQGLTHYRADRLAAARPLFDQAVRLAPDLLAARFWRAKLAVRENRLQDAVADLEVVVRLKPTSAPSWLELARCYHSLGDLDRADAACAEALRHDPRLTAASQLRQTLAATRPAAPALTPRPDPNLGPRLAIAADGIKLGTAPPAVEGGRLYDYTFGAAPTDWLPAGGVWAISSRYACEPEWSFFGGYSRGVCALWNKRAFAGDIAVEAYVAFIHGLPWAPEKWHYVPSDLNLTLCARDGDLASGYSFIYSGRNGSTTMLRKGRQILAETRDPEFVLPQFLDLNPLFQRDDEGRDFGQFHRHWWRLEARRSGRRLTFLIDGRTALEADDPEPLEAGRIALWTVGSGFVVARVRVAYQRELSSEQPALVVTTPAPLGPVASR